MLNISTIQHFSVGDGDGIRTTVFFKGCNLHCPWCHNPENLSKEPVTLHYDRLNKTEILGKQVSAEELLPELLEDKDFYDQSGGGVTFSGGEVMLQAAQVSELAVLLKAHGVSVLIDTAGCVPYRQFELLNHTVDGYLFDFKTADENRYHAIGGDLQLVTDNIQRLRNEGMAVYIRIPLIPQFNTDERSLRAISAHLRSMGLHRVELLPFHRLGSAKYEALGWQYAYGQTPSMGQEELNSIQAFFRSEGFEALKGG